MTRRSGLAVRRMPIHSLRSIQLADVVALARSDLEDEPGIHLQHQRSAICCASLRLLRRHSGYITLTDMRVIASSTMGTAVHQRFLDDSIKNLLNLAASSGTFRDP